MKRGGEAKTKQPLLSETVSTKTSQPKISDGPFILLLAESERLKINRMFDIIAINNKDVDRHW